MEGIKLDVFHPVVYQSSKITPWYTGLVYFEDSGLSTVQNHQLRCWSPGLANSFCEQPRPKAASQGTHLHFERRNLAGSDPGYKSMSMHFFPEDANFKWGFLHFLRVQLSWKSKVFELKTKLQNFNWCLSHEIPKPANMESWLIIAGVSTSNHKFKNIQECFKKTQLPIIFKKTSLEQKKQHSLFPPKKWLQPPTKNLPVKKHHFGSWFFPIPPYRSP